MHLFNFYLFQTPSEAGSLYNLEADYPLLAEISCTCGWDCGDMSILLILFGATLRSCLGFFLEYYSRSGYPWGKYYLLHRSVSCVAQDLSNLEVLCLPSLTELWETHHQTPHEIGVRNDQFLGWEPDLLILHKMVSDKDISMHARRVATWVIHLYWLEILHLRHKLDIPMCGGFKEWCLLLCLKTSPWE